MNPEYKLSKLKPIDYEEMNLITNNYKLKSDLSTEKMNSILTKTKISKVNCQNIEHKKIWNLESMRLNNIKRKLQRKLNSFVSLKGSNSNLEGCSWDLSQLEENIMNDHTAFKSNVIDPVWTLCEDVKEWKLKKSRGYRVPDCQPIRELIITMKSQLKEIATDLRAEEECLMNGLETEIEKYSISINSENIHEKVGTGIPSEAWEIECLDKSFLTELLSQFLHLDTSFQTKLDHIDEECNFNERSSLEEWSEAEIESYNHLLDSYLLHATINRNILLKSILKIVFPNHSNQNMMEIDKYIHSKRLFRDKLQALAADWKRDREELFVKIKASIMYYNEQIITAQLESQKVKDQKEICSQLTEQLNDWREKKEQLNALEEAVKIEIEKKLKAEEDEKLRKETEMRNKTKKMIYQYKFEKSLQIDKKIEEKQRRIEELKEYLRNQRVIDEERAKYREELRQVKLKEDQFKKQQLIEQKNNAEIRLNQLIEQVRPNVESDPERIMKPTSTWLNHTEDLKDKSETETSTVGDFNIGARYAVPLHTYNDKELLSNPRLRVENALREAGLINSEYARNILKSLPANQLPRKDCISDSNFLKHE